MRLRPFIKNPWSAIAVLAAVLLSAGGPALAAEGEGGSFYFGGPGQAIITLLIFLLLLAVLGKWAWKPVVKQLERREQTIADALAEARKRQKEAEEMMARYKARMDQAEAAAQELLTQARKEAVAAREKVLAVAAEEARRAGQQASAEIDRAKREALVELHDATAKLAAEIAAKVIRRNLSPDDHKRMLDESLEEIRRRAASQ